MATLQMYNGSTWEVVSGLPGPAGVDGVGGGAVQTKTTTYVALSTDGVVLANAASGGFTVTLPAVVSGESLIVKKIDPTSNLVTVLPASGTIDGSANDVLNAQWQSRTYVSDGSAWFRV